MGIGQIKLTVTSGNDLYPAAGAHASILYEGTAAGSLNTNLHGQTDKLPLEVKNCGGEPFDSFDVHVSAPGHNTVQVKGVKVFSSVTTLLPVHLAPETEGEIVYRIPNSSQQMPEQTERRCPSDYSLFTDGITIPEK